MYRKLQKNARVSRTDCGARSLRKEILQTGDSLCKVCYNKLFKKQKGAFMFEGFSQEALDFLNDIRFNNHQQFY